MDSLPEPQRKAIESMRQYIPTSESEFAYRTLRPVWSDIRESPGINKDVTTRYVDENGSEVSRETAYKLFEIFNQDARLGNLSELRGELFYCRYHYDLAHDCLEFGIPEAGLMALERSTSVIETSQSKGGWLRRILSTFIHEQVIKDSLEPKKSAFFGGKKEGGQ